MSDQIVRNLHAIRQHLPETTKLVAVSKTHSVDLIRCAYGAGVRDFAENRLQEALQKQAELEDLADIRWHFIGHLQKNKAKKAIAHFDWIHTIDSLALAQKLDGYAAENPKTPQCCLQVKPLPDPNKFGWDIPQLWQDLPELAKCRNLKIQGLMTILPLGLSPQETIAAFTLVKELEQKLNQDPACPFDFTELSMGMSGDYAQAIAAGSTMVRVGSAIFGQRNQVSKA